MEVQVELDVPAVLEAGKVGVVGGRRGRGRGLVGSATAGSGSTRACLLVKRKKRKKLRMKSYKSKQIELIIE